MRKWVLCALTLIGFATSAVGVYNLATTGSDKNAIVGGVFVVLMGWWLIGDKKE